MIVLSSSNLLISYPSKNLFLHFFLSLLYGLARLGFWPLLGIQARLWVLQLTRLLLPRLGLRPPQLLLLLTPPQQLVGGNSNVFAYVCSVNDGKGGKIPLFLLNVSLNLCYMLCPAELSAPLVKTINVNKYLYCCILICMFALNKIYPIDFFNIISVWLSW